MKKVPRKTSFGLNALVWKEKDLFVAKAIEVEVASQGKTKKQALSNLKEAIELYFEGEKLPQKAIAPLTSLKLQKFFPKLRYA